MSDNPLYYDVATLLQSAGLGLALGDNLFGGEWGDPHKQVLVVEGVGVVSDLSSLYRQPGVQILVRGSKGEADVDVARLAQQVYDFMVTRPDNLEVNGTCYKGFEPSTNLSSLGKDENDRPQYTMNFTTYRNGSGGH